jgi:hypothetical protein
LNDIMYKFEGLPRKVQDVVKALKEDESFIAAVKTGYKPTATIPILWLVITSNGLLLCNTHSKRGLYQHFRKNAIDFIKVRRSIGMESARMTITPTDSNIDDFAFPFMNRIDLDELLTLLKRNGYKVL